MLNVEGGGRQPPPGRPPAVTIEPTYKQAREGEYVELVCNTDRDPATTVTWTRGAGVPLSSQVMYYSTQMYFCSILEY